jgi:hypothetical protein
MGREPPLSQRMHFGTSLRYGGLLSGRTGLVQVQLLPSQHLPATAASLAVFSSGTGRWPLSWRAQTKKDFVPSDGSRGNRRIANSKRRKFRPASVQPRLVGRR